MDLPQQVKLIIKMIEYIEKVIEDIPVEFAGELVTLARAHLFDTNEDREKLEPSRVAKTHHIIAKNVLLSKRERTENLLET